MSEIETDMYIAVRRGSEPWTVGDKVEIYPVPEGVRFTAPEAGWYRPDTGEIRLADGLDQAESYLWLLRVERDVA